MFFRSLLRIFLMLTITFILFFLLVLLFHPILSAESLMFPYSITPFDICKEFPDFWVKFKIAYLTALFLSCLLISNSFLSQFFKSKKNCAEKKSFKKHSLKTQNSFSLLIGNTFDTHMPVYISEKRFISEYPYYRNHRKW